jgi:hypothetical protein
MQLMENMILYAIVFARPVYQELVQHVKPTLKLYLLALTTVSVDLDSH